jgi:succinyl-CoA synthetase alpha subunit
MVSPGKAIIGVGGDAFVGATWSELLPLFERDPETKMLALFGEIGTSNEEDAAALISRGMGTAESKIAALREAGVHIVEHLGDIGPTARRT